MATNKITKELQKEFEKIIDRVEKSLKKSDLQDLGDTAVELMKDMISKGISPIKSMGRFPAYKRGQDPTGYPRKLKNKFPEKKARPVNLKLTGEFLEDLDARSNASKQSIEIGFYKAKSAEKERGHREGANSQPKRPVIPERNETLADSIKIELYKRLQTVLDRIK